MQRAILRRTAGAGPGTFSNCRQVLLITGPVVRYIFSYLYTVFISQPFTERELMTKFQTLSDN